MSDYVRWPVPKATAERRQASRTQTFLGLQPPFSISPDLIDQSGIVISLADVEQQVLMDLIDQQGVTFDPAVSAVEFILPSALIGGGPQPAPPTKRSQVFWSPAAEVVLTPGLIDQAGTTFDLQINQQTLHDFIDQAGIVFSPTVNLGASIGIIDQAGITFEPSVSGGTGGLTVSPSLIDQSGVTFSPQFNFRISPGLIDQAGVVFSPQFNLSVSPGLIDQSGVVFTPTRVFVSSVSPSLIDQSGTTFSPTIEGGEVVVVSGAKFFEGMSRMGG